MKKELYSVGIDFGTNAVRTVILDIYSGEEVATASCDYLSGRKGVLLHEDHPHLARQYPGDYFYAMENAVGEAMRMAAERGVDKKQIVGIGVDTTGSTPLPVDKNMVALGLKEPFKDNLNAQAWLWKDHSAAAEAQEITGLAKEIRPQYLKKCGGAYSSEWFFSKIYHCLKEDKEVFDAADSWLELSDYIPAILCGVKDVHQVKRNICAAGHKAMYNHEWGGIPDKEFLSNLSPKMGDLYDRLYHKAYSVEDSAGYLCDEWAEKLKMPANIPVSVGALDAHVGAIGSGVGKGILVKIIGTSTCDIMVHPAEEKIKDIPGVAGIVYESVLPGYTGIEAGQSAVGDIFNWFVSEVLKKDELYHQKLSEQAAQLNAGESGLLALDWHNGNRNILTDPRLSGMVLGQNLQTKDYEIYRALIEATAFGALRIIEQMEQYGLTIDKVVNCGGIPQKNELLMQIYADVLDRPMIVSEATETVALGAAIIGGYVAMKGEQGFENIETLQSRTCKVKNKVFHPNGNDSNVYRELYSLYKLLHDAFGVKDTRVNLYPAMKRLIEIKIQQSSH